MPRMPLAEEDDASVSDTHSGKSSSRSIELSECVDSTDHSLVTAWSHAVEPQVETICGAVTAPQVRELWRSDEKWDRAHRSGMVGANFG
jgi:hypothetical protein